MVQSMHSIEIDLAEHRMHVNGQHITKTKEVFKDIIGPADWFSMPHANGQTRKGRAKFLVAE